MSSPARGLSLSPLKNVCAAPASGAALQFSNTQNVYATNNSARLLRKLCAIGAPSAVQSFPERHNGVDCLQADNRKLSTQNLTNFPMWPGMPQPLEYHQQA